MRALGTTNLIVVLVHGGRADAGGASVLLDGGLGPATEVGPVRVGRVVVVVGVPIERMYDNSQITSADNREHWTVQNQHSRLTIHSATRLHALSR